MTGVQTCALPISTGVNTSVDNLGDLLYEDISGISSITNDAPEFFPLGETTVTWIVVDNYNNSTDGSQIITVVDTTNPDIFPPRAIITEAKHNSENTIELENPRVYDHVEISSLVNDAPEFFPLGETTVTWTVTDTSGNTTSAEQLVSVVDTISPTLVQPIDLVIEINNLSGMVLEIGTAIATDIVDASPIVSNDAPEFFPLGETTVTWTVTDTSGNTSSLIQNISVQACGKSESYYNQILGTPDDDILIGTNLPDLIFSFSGDDIISGDKGNDCILAGDGDDIIFGDEGNDNISGGSGSDIIKGQSGEDILKGGLGLDIVNGGDDLDVYKTVDELNSDLVLNCETTE